MPDRAEPGSAPGDSGALSILASKVSQGPHAILAIALLLAASLLGGSVAAGAGVLVVLAAVGGFLVVAVAAFAVLMKLDNRSGAQHRRERAAFDEALSASFASMLLNVVNQLLSLDDPKTQRGQALDGILAALLLSAELNARAGKGDLERAFLHVHEHMQGQLDVQTALARSMDSPLAGA